MPRPTFEQWYNANKEALTKKGITNSADLYRIYQQKLVQHGYATDNSQSQQTQQSNQSQDISSKTADVVDTNPSVEEQEYDERRKSYMHFFGIPQAQSYPKEMIDKIISDRNKSENLANQETNTSELNNEPIDWNSLGSIRQEESTPQKVKDVQNGLTDWAFNIADKFKEKPRLIEESWDEKGKLKTNKEFERAQEYNELLTDYNIHPDNSKNDAIKISNLLKQEGNEYYLNHSKAFELNDDNAIWWMKTNAQFKSDIDTYGEAAALKNLHEAVETRAIESLNGLQQFGRTMRGFGVNALAGASDVGAFCYGLLSSPFALAGIGNDTEMNNLNYALTHIFVNGWSEYDQRMMEQGKIFPKADFNPEIQEGKTRLNTNTFGGMAGELVKQMGFTAGSAIAGGIHSGVGKIGARAAVSSIEKNLVARVISKEIAEKEVAKVMAREMKWAKSTGYVLAAGEGATNGADTYINSLRNAEKDIERIKTPLRDAYMSKLLQENAIPSDKDGNPILPNGGENVYNMQGLEPYFDAYGNKYWLTKEDRMDMMIAAEKLMEDQVNRDLAAADAKARQAGAWAGLVSFGITSVTNNIGLNYFLNDAQLLTARARMGSKSIMSNIGFTAENTIGLINEKAAKKQAMKIASGLSVWESFTEGLEEGVQGFGQAINESISDNSFDQYLKAKYLEGKEADAAQFFVDGSLIAGLEGASNYATTQLGRDFLTGALMGQLNVNTNIISGLRGTNKSENESWQEKFTRLSPLRVGPIATYGEVNQKMRDLKEYARNATDAIKNMPQATNLSDILGWGMQLDKSAMSGNMADLESTILGQLTNGLMDMKNFSTTLQENMGKSYYQMLREKMIDIKNGKISDQEIAEAINENRGEQRLEVEDAAAEGKKYAQRVLDAINAIDEATNEVNKNGRYTDRDSRAAIVFMKAHNKLYKQQIDELGEELDGVSVQGNVNIDTRTPNSSKPFGIFKSRAQRAMSEKLMMLKKKKDALESNLQIMNETPDALRQNYNEQAGEVNSHKVYSFLHGKVKLWEERTQDINDELEKTKKEIQELQNKFKGVFTDEDAGVLTQGDIMVLPTEQRAFVMDESNASLFSEQQNDVIKRLRNSGNLNVNNFASKIQQHAQMTMRYKENEKVFSKSSEDQQWMQNRLAAAKEYSMKNLGVNEAKTLAKIDDYDTFVTLLKDLKGRLSDMSYNAMIKSLRDNDNFKKYNTSRKSATTYMINVRNSRGIRNNKNIDQSLLPISVEVVRTLSEDYGFDVSKDSLMDKYDIVKSVISRILNSHGIDSSSNNIDKIIHIINTVEDTIKTNVAEEKKAKPEAKPTTENTKNGKKDKPKEKPKEKEKSIPENASELLKDVDEEQVLNDSSEVMSMISNKEAFRNILHSILNNAESNNEIHVILNTLIGLSKELKGKPESLFFDAITKKAKEYNKYTLQPYPRVSSQLGLLVKEYKGKKVTDEVPVSSDGGRIETIRLDTITNAYKAFYYNYGVREFLESDVLTGEEEVFFMNSSDLSGTNDESVTSSVIAVVRITDMKTLPDKCKTIDIGENKYMPIGIVPAKSDDGKYEGSQNTGFIHDNVGRVNSDGLICDSNNQPVKTKLEKHFVEYSDISVKQSRQPLNRAPFTKKKTVKDVLSWILRTNVFSSKKNQEYPVLGISSKSNSNFSVRKNSESNQNNHMKIWIAEMNEMVDSDGKSMYDALVDSKYDICQFNERTKQFEDNLSNLLARVLILINKEKNVKERDSEIRKDIIYNLVSHSDDLGKSDNTIFNIMASDDFVFEIKEENGDTILSFKTEPKDFTLKDEYTKNCGEINITQYLSDKADQKKMVNALANDMFRGLVMDKKRESIDYRSIGEEEKRDEGYVKWNVDYGSSNLGEQLLFTESQIDAGSDVKEKDDNAIKALKHKLKAYKQFYNSGIFVISTRVSNVYLQSPAAKAAIDNKPPKSTEPSNADMPGENGPNIPIPGGNVDKGTGQLEGSGNPPSGHQSKIEMAKAKIREMLDKFGNRPTNRFNVTWLYNDETKATINKTDTVFTLKGKAFEDFCQAVISEPLSFKIVKDGILYTGTKVIKLGNKEYKNGSKIGNITIDLSKNKKGVAVYSVTQLIDIYNSITDLLLNKIKNQNGEIINAKKKLYPVVKVIETLQDNKTKEHQINVAMELDLLVVNDDGTVDIYDFKATEEDVKTLEFEGQKSMDKYTRQLQMYGTLINQMTGLSIRNLYIFNGYGHVGEKCDIQIVQVENKPYSIDYNRELNKLNKEIEQVKAKLEDRDKMSENIYKRWEEKLKSLESQKTMLEAEVTSLGAIIEEENQDNGTGEDSGSGLPNVSGLKAGEQKDKNGLGLELTDEEKASKDLANKLTNEAQNGDLGGDNNDSKVLEELQAKLDSLTSADSDQLEEISEYASRVREYLKKQFKGCGVKEKNNPKEQLENLISVIQKFSKEQLEVLKTCGNL